MRQRELRLLLNNLVSTEENAQECSLCSCVFFFPENKILVDSLTAVCYSEKCYIMARYACLPEKAGRVML